MLGIRSPSNGIVISGTISIPKAKVAAGLGNNHLAACGDSLVTFPYAAAPTYQQVKWLLLARLNGNWY